MAKDEPPVHFELIKMVKGLSRKLLIVVEKDMDSNIAPFFVLFVKEIVKEIDSNISPFFSLFVRSIGILLTRLLYDIITKLN